MVIYITNLAYMGIPMAGSAAEVLLLRPLLPLRARGQDAVDAAARRGGGDMSTVGVSELVIFDPNRAFSCGPGCCPNTDGRSASTLTPPGSRVGRDASDVRMLRRAR